MAKCVLAWTALLGMAGLVQAQTTLVNYPFAANANPSVVDPSVGVIFTNPNTAVVGDDGFGVVYQAYPVAGSTSAATAVSTSSFFSLTVLKASSLGPLAVQFDVGKGGNSDPRGLRVRTSLDNFLSDVFNETLPAGAQAAPVNKAFTVDATGQTTITFRFYVWAPTTNNSVDFRNLKVSTAPAPVPAPTLSQWSLMLMGALLAAIALVRLQRQGRT
jgi:hypothetical protein